MKTRMTDLQQFNGHKLSMRRVAIRGGVAVPTAMKYMKGEIEHPLLPFVAAILHGMGVDWRRITLGELLEVVDEDAKAR